MISTVAATIRSNILSSKIRSIVSIFTANSITNMIGFSRPCIFVVPFGFSVCSLGRNRKTEQISIASDSAEYGKIIPKNSENDKLNFVYRYKFCGLPIGVSILPRLAAAVSRTSSTISARAFFSPEIFSNISSVNGTRVTSVTSLVNSILMKKLSKTSTRPTVFMLRNFFSRASHMIVNAPVCRIPATTSIKQNKSISTRRSTYSAYAVDGGTIKQETAANIPDTQSTASFLKNSTMTFNVIQPPTMSFSSIIISRFNVFFNIFSDHKRSIFKPHCSAYRTV